MAWRAPIPLSLSKTGRSMYFLGGSILHLEWGEHMDVKKPDLTREYDRSKLRNWMTNARRHGREDLYQDAFRQLCRLEGRDLEDPLAADFAAVMRALEEALTQEAGRT